MPRGVKKKRDFGKELEMIDEKIAKKLDQIENLKLQRAAIEAAREQSELHQVYEAMRASGKTPEEVVAMLNAQSESV